MIDNQQLSVALSKTFGFKNYSILTGHPQFADKSFDRIVTLKHAHEFITFARTNGIQRINHVIVRSTQRDKQIHEFSFAFENVVFVTRDAAAFKLISQSGFEIVDET